MTVNVGDTVRLADYDTLYNALADESARLGDPMRIDLRLALAGIDLEEIAGSEYTVTGTKASALAEYGEDAGLDEMPEDGIFVNPDGEGDLGIPAAGYTLVTEQVEA